MAINQTTELEFAQIKENLKNFLRNQSEFTDYDFEGSGLNVILDLLAYNTQYNALLAHMNLNEVFIDTAQQRKSVVSHASLLGYTPSSARAAKAILTVNVLGDSVSPETLQIPAGFTLTSSSSQGAISFVTRNSYTATKSPGTNIYTFSGVEVFQGSLRRVRYRVDAQKELPKYRIPSENVDTITLGVNVYDSASAVTFRPYTFFEDITQIRSNSEVYYLNEDARGFFEVSFGDDVLGRKLTEGQIVEIFYIETGGEIGNGITAMTPNNSVEGYTVQSVSVTSRSQGGTEKEGIESIRFNAPLGFANQNRAVTTKDYKSLIINRFPSLEDVTVWGGEDAETPVYGKVFISAKPFNSLLVSENFKSAVIGFLSEYNVGSTIVEFIDPEFTFLKIEALVKYNPTVTNKSISELRTLIKNAIISYADDSLEKFDSVLRYSRLSTKIDTSDPSILNNIMRITMQKRVVALPNIEQEFEIRFSNSIEQNAAEASSIKSSIFSVDGTDVYIRDIYNERTFPIREVSLYRASDDTQLADYNNVGTLDPDKGILKINKIPIDEAVEIAIEVSPDSFDVKSNLNQLISIPENDITVTVEADTLASVGSTTSATYRTFDKK